MKKLALALAVSAVASLAQAQVAGSPHDFTAGFTGAVFTTTNVSACTFCHAPHNANTAVVGAPLWNRPTSTTAAYTMYTSATLDGARTAAPGVNSLTCLTCHDGAQAIAVVYNGGTPRNLSNEANVSPVTGVFNVGTALTNDHPVGITYDNVADPSLRAAPTNTALRLYNYGAGALRQVECGTCHDPHNNVNGNFLVTANTAVALCGACHTQ